MECLFANSAGANKLYGLIIFRNLFVQATMQRLPRIRRCQQAVRAQDISEFIRSGDQGALAANSAGVNNKLYGLIIFRNLFVQATMQRLPRIRRCQQAVRAQDISEFIRSGDQGALAANSAGVNNKLYGLIIFRNLFVQATMQRLPRIRRCQQAVRAQDISEFIRSGDQGALAANSPVSTSCTGPGHFGIYSFRRPCSACREFAGVNKPRAWWGRALWRSRRDRSRARFTRRRSPRWTDHKPDRRMRLLHSTLPWRRGAGPVIRTSTAPVIGLRAEDMLDSDPHGGLSGCSSGPARSAACPARPCAECGWSALWP